MEELIKAYLQHTGHYLAGNEILYIEAHVEHGEQTYAVNIKNECLAQGFELTTVTIDKLLTFLYERTL